MRKAVGLFCLLFTVFLSTAPVIQAQTYSLSPTPTRTPTPTVTLFPSQSVTPTNSSGPTSCDELVVVSGNESNAPATVTFNIKATNPSSSTSKYRIYFGDTQMTESNIIQNSHPYASSGTYTAVAQVRDSQGNWITSSQCVKTVTVRPIPLVQNIETHRGECSNVLIMNRDQTQAPSTIQFLITGFDNKGRITKTRIEYGDGTSDEKSTSAYNKTYSTPGTYIVKAYIYDTTNIWKGGTQGCAISIPVTSSEPMTQQPSTGTPSWFTLLALGSGAASMFLYRKLQKTR